MGMEWIGLCGFGWPLILFGGAILFMTFRIVPHWERGVVLTLGKYSRDVKPGLNIIIPFVERMITVDTRITTVDIPKQEVMTKDNVPVYVNAVVYFRVEDPKKSILKIVNYPYAVAQYSQTALRDVIGGIELDTLLTEREKIAREIKTIVDAETANWGVDITSIKIQDIELPKDMKRAMARQAEAEREKRGLIIKSEGEKEAAKNIADASRILAASPGALHLRTLNTLADISGDPSMKVVYLLPIEVLDAFKAVSEGSVSVKLEGSKSSSKKSSKK